LTSISLKRRIALAISLAVVVLFGAVSQVLADTYYKTNSSLTPGTYMYCESGYCAPYTPVFTMGHGVSGVDSALYSDKIWIQWHEVFGVIKNVNMYPFEQSVTVQSGHFNEVAIPGYITDFSYGQTDLSPISSILYQTGDQPWQGGTQNTGFYMNKLVNAWENVAATWVGSDNITWFNVNTVSDSFTFHTINGWQNQ